MQSSLMAVLQSTACVSSKACKWAAGEGSDALLAKAKKASGSCTCAELIRVCRVHLLLRHVVR